MILKGKKGLIMGVANDKSIAWGIAQSLSNQGAEIILSYPNQQMQKRVEKFSAQITPEYKPIECNVQDDDSIDIMVDKLKKTWGQIDFLVHSVAFCNKEELKGRYIDTDRGNFLEAMDISCYSLALTCKKVEPILAENASIITMSYIGAVRYIANYNLMGVCKAALESSVRYLAADLSKNNVRVNAISAGPVRTLASSAIGDFKGIMRSTASNSFTGENITTEDVGGAAVYLISDFSKATTGSTLYVDGGFYDIGITPDLVSNFSNE